MSDSPPPHDLDYARPPRQQEARRPVVGLILFGWGAVICVGNFALIIYEGGGSFLSPGLGSLSLLFFAVGAVASALHRNRRGPAVLGPPRRGAPLLVFLNLAGFAISLFVACAGVPSR